jgi:hypothetical protein
VSRSTVAENFVHQTLGFRETEREGERQRERERELETIKEIHKSVPSTTFMAHNFITPPRALAPNPRQPDKPD